MVLTTYFPLYLTEITGTNWSLGAATTGSMVLAALAIPVLGALSDQTGKTKNYLIRTTVLAVAFLFCFVLTKNPILLTILFLIACFFFHASLVFYNTLLPVAAPPEHQGFASGLGTGLGYLGVVVALPLMHIVDGSLGRVWVFPASGILFLLFALPLFLFVPERDVEHPIKFRRQLWGEEWRKLRGTIRGLATEPKLLLFLGGNFFVVDAMNSLIFWVSVYTREVFNPGQSDIISFLLILNASAFAMGLLNGVLTDRIRAFPTMILSSATLALMLVGLTFITDFWLFRLVAVTAGAFAISGIWTAGRKVLLELAPANSVGEYFGLYGLTTKISVVASLLFSVTADVSGFQSALWILVFPAAVGCAFLIASAMVPLK